MTLNGWLQILLFLAAVAAVTVPLGRFMARVFARERTWLDPVLRPLERLIYRLTGVDETHEMRWTEYGLAMLAFSLVSMLVLYALQRLQGCCRSTRRARRASAPDLAFNTAASFTTNTNWQSYVGETTMSYLTQMAGLAYHNFISAAAGIALAIAFIRGIAGARARHARQLLGRHDPRHAVGAAAVLPRRRAAAGLAGRGPEPEAVRPRAARRSAGRDVDSEQVIAQGPVASQEIIKEWGTNGGGFFNANSAHPFENPTPFTNFIADVRDLRDLGRVSPTRSAG